MKRIYVYLEMFQGKLSMSDLGCLEAASEAAEPGDRVMAFVYGRPQDAGRCAKELFSRGVDTLLWIRGSDFDKFLLSGQAILGMAQYLERDRKAGAVIFPATPLGNRLAAHLGIRLCTASILDCIQIAREPKAGNFLFDRPSERGRKIIRYAFPQDKLPIATLKRNPHMEGNIRLQRSVPLEGGISLEEAIPLEGSIRRQGSERRQCQIIFLDPEPVSPKACLISRKEIAAPSCDITSQPCLVAGGLGIRRREDFRLLEQLAEKLGGALCVTRPIVEKGWYPQDIQVGLSGKQVSPRRYLAIGISGAFQHTVGMSESDYIIAINLDRNAPIFDVADFGIVGDYREIIPHFYRLLAEASVL